MPYTPQRRGGVALALATAVSLMLVRCSPEEGVYFRCDEGSTCSQRDPLDRPYVCHTDDHCYPPDQVPGQGGDAGPGDAGADAGPGDDGGPGEDAGVDAGMFSGLPNAGRRCLASGLCYLNPRYGGADLKSVWGTSANDVFIVGNEGTLLYWDGTDVRRVDPGTSEGLNDVWAAGPHVLIAGDRKTLLTWDGGAFQQALDDAQALPLLTASGFGPSLMSAGLGGVVERHPTSGGWEDALSISGGVRAAWGFGPRRYWLVSTAQTLLEVQDGQVVATVDAGLSGESLLDVDGVGAFAVAVGVNGARVIWDGGIWTPAPIGSGELLTGVKVFTDGGWITTSVGHRLFRTGANGSATPIESGTVERLNAVWGVSPADSWAVGVGGTIVRNAGGGWREVPGFEVPAFVDVASSSDGRLWALADNGALYTEKANGLWSTAVDGGGATGLALWVAGNSAWVLEGNSTIRRVDLGTGESEVEHLGSGSESLTDLWGDDVSAIYAVGGSGRIRIRLSPTLWTETASSTSTSLTTIGGVKGQVWVGGLNGVLLRLEDNSFTPHHAPAGTGTITGVWSDSSGNAFASTNDAEIATWTGTEWTVEEQGEASKLLDINGTSIEDLWTVGPGGVLLRLEGGVWQRHPTLSVGTTLSAIHAGDGGLTVVGHRGVVLHRP